jgi:hypothetical protein
MYLISVSVAGGSTCPWRKEECKFWSSQNSDMIATDRLNGGLNGEKDVSVTRLAFAIFRPASKRRAVSLNFYVTVLLPAPCYTAKANAISILSMHAALRGVQYQTLPWLWRVTEWEGCRVARYMPLWIDE